MQRRRSISVEPAARLRYGWDPGPGLQRSDAAEGSQRQGSHHRVQAPSLQTPRPPAVASSTPSGRGQRRATPEHWPQALKGVRDQFQQKGVLMITNAPLPGRGCSSFSPADRQASETVH